MNRIFSYESRKLRFSFISVTSPFIYFPGTQTSRAFQNFHIPSSRHDDHYIKVQAPAMPDQLERMYCSEQIHIPPTFPYIMKLYCKAAIRTQPYDLLKWSAAYFRALANGEAPPAKERIEYPPYDSPTGLTPGYLKVLVKQIGKDPAIELSAQTLFIKWNGVCMQEILLIKLLALMGARTTFSWLKFLSVAAGSITSTLTQTMILICELLTDEPEGGMATMPLNVFNELYTYLAFMNCGPLTEDEMAEVDSFEIEEDISVIAEKLRSGDYGEQLKDDGLVGEDEICYDKPYKRAVSGESREQLSEEESTAKDEQSPVMKASAVGLTGAVDDTVETAVGKLTEEVPKDEADASQVESETMSVRSPIDSSSVNDDVKDQRSSSAVDVADEPAVEHKPEKAEVVEQLEGVLGDEETETPLDTHRERESTIETARINLDDLDEDLRHQVEEKLAAEEMSSESDVNFDALGSYLLGSAARAKTFTADEIGYRIFRKYLRQEVSGIGPVIDKEQVEKVTDFMDYWSNKQEGMVMPRNIRHWMCPPLDQLPVPEP